MKDWHKFYCCFALPAICIAAGLIFIFRMNRALAALSIFYNLTSFQYINNWYWLLAVVPVILLFVFYARWKASIRKKLGDARLIDQLLVGWSATRHRVKALMIAVAVLLLGFCTMNLQKPIQQGQAGLSGLDVMLAIDVSNSMLSTDVPPNRLEKAKLFASKLIDTLQGNRVGVVAFAGEAFLQLPLTTDIAAARLFLPSVNTKIVPRQGTDIANALQVASQSLNPNENKYKALILITDGEEHDAQALAKAKELKKEGVVIFTIGVGTPAGANITDETGQTKRDEKGEPVISKLNEALLTQLAESTHGSFTLLGQTDATVQQVLAELQHMDQKPIANANLMNYQSLVYWLIALAFVLLLVEWLLPERKNKKGTVILKKIKPAAVLLLCMASFTAGAQNNKSLLRKANEAYRLQHYDEAEKLYHEILKAEPDNTVARYNLGNIAYRRKAYTEAQGKYKEVSEKSADNKARSGAWNNKGLSLVQEKKLPEAVNAFKESVRINPNDSVVRKNLNKALKELEQQQQQAPKPEEKKKEQPKNKMKKEQAEDKLQALQQQEKQIREKMSQQRQTNTEKDW